MADIYENGRAVGVELVVGSYALESYLRQQEEHGGDSDGQHRRPAGVLAPVPDFLVDVDCAVPAAEHEHGDKEPGDQAALTADAVQAEPGRRDVHGACVMTEYPGQAPYGE